MINLGFSGALKMANEERTVERERAMQTGWVRFFKNQRRTFSGHSLPGSSQLAAASRAAESFDFAKQSSIPHKLKDSESRRQ